MRDNDRVCGFAPMNRLELKNLPSPLFAKEGYCPSLWKREGGRDFMKHSVFILRLYSVWKRALMKGKLLIVDDDRVFCSALARHFEREYAVTGFSTPRKLRLSSVPIRST